MSFHGGLLGVVLAVWLFCRRHKLELLAGRRSGLRVVAPIGLFFGRIANFVNGELWGTRHRRALGDGVLRARAATRLPRHPSQLYEAALEGMVLFVILQIALRVFRAA